MREEPKYIVDEKGEKEAVVLPLDEYEELIEDLHDLAIVAERRSENSLPWEDVREKLKRDGLLPD